MQGFSWNLLESSPGASVRTYFAKFFQKLVCEFSKQLFWRISFSQLFSRNSIIGIFSGNFFKIYNNNVFGNIFINCCAFFFGNVFGDCCGNYLPYSLNDQSITTSAIYSKIPPLNSFGNLMKLFWKIIRDLFCYFPWKFLWNLIRHFVFVHFFLISEIHSVIPWQTSFRSVLE